MSVPAWIRNMLEQEHVPFEERHHAEAFTAQEVAHAEHVSGHRVAKVVVVMADGAPVELILPASKRVCLDRVREILRTNDVRLASEREIEWAFPGCEPGAVPALDCWTGVDVLMDESMAGPGYILIQAGNHEDAIRLRFNDWQRIVRPLVEHFTEPQDAPAPAPEPAR